ncbi:unnamed protein product [Wickerhamomyces anomalus]
MDRHLRPHFEEDDYDEEVLNQMLRNAESEEDSDDEGYGALSFGALKNAQDKMDKEERNTTKQPKQPIKKSREQKKPIAVKETRKKKSKHAPTEASSKKPVSKIRQIPGLDNPKYKTLYKDIRFDTALGKADLSKVRKDYKFLDDYRQSEIDQINKMLKDPKVKNKLSDREVRDMEYQAKSLKSRLDSLKNKDLQKEVLQKYKEQNKGTNGGKFYLKKSEQRKIIQKHKFDTMKASQREKVMERKRKRRLGKEFKQLEFNKPRN